MAGKFFEDFTVDDVIQHAMTRTVTETDNVLFCGLTMNPQPLHLDHEFAARSTFGQPVVNGLYTLALMMGMTVLETTLGTTEGNLGFDKIQFQAPVFYGDTIHSETEVRAVRPSKSKPALGIVTFEHRAINQHDKVVLTCQRSGLIRRKGERNAS